MWLVLFYAIGLYLDRHMWVVVAVLDSTVPDHAFERLFLLSFLRHTEVEVSEGPNTVAVLNISAVHLA